MLEVWKTIEGYEKYSVSNLGRIRRSDDHKLLKPVKNYNNYLVVGLSNNGSVKTKRVHRLVAEAFIPNLLNKPEVNHLDENKSNNAATNLEWSTRIENANWGTAISRAHKKTSKQILVTKDNFTNIFDSISYFAKTINGTQSGVVHALKRKRKYKGFEVSYVE